MYKIQNEEYYKLYDVTVCDFVRYFYTKDTLIKFISGYFYEDFPYVMEDGYNLYFPHKRYGNSFIEQCTCIKEDLWRDCDDIFYRRYLLLDNHDRIINVKDFESEAFKLYLKDGTYPSLRWFYNRRSSKKNLFWKKMQNNYTYRKDPVPGTRKVRGGSRWKNPHTSQIIKMYLNPEYKGFNRGSLNEVPQWWDDKIRTVQKSWKEQRKIRHQWQKNL